MLAVFAVLARVARVAPVAGGERGVSNETNHEWQRKRHDQDALADHMNLRGIAESVTPKTLSGKNQI
jgi:hypothetical protein